MDKKLEDMSPDELRALADLKEKEKWVDPNKPIKEGFLKEDIYNADIEYSVRNHWGFLTEIEIDHHINRFEELFITALRRGDRFLCYNVDGEELWSDDVGYGIEEVDNSWAAKFLENIKDLK